MMRLWVLMLAGCAATPEMVPGPTEEPPTSTSDPSFPGPGHTTGFELPADGSLPQLRKLQTEHLGQLTGTHLNPSGEVGILGTDLGASFERDGKLVFIFGDSWTPGGTRQDQDSLAWTTASDLSTMPKLHWIVDGANQFVAPRLQGVNLQGMNVPMEGIADGAQTWVFFTTGF